MGFNPGSTLGATDLRIGLVAVNTLLVGVRRLRDGDGHHQRQVRQARHLDVVQRHARRSRRDHRAAARSSRRGPRWSSAASPACSSSTASRSSTGVDIDDPCGAISVHGVSGAWGVLAVGLFADGTYGAGWNGVGATARTACGAVLRRRRPARRADRSTSSSDSSGRGASCGSSSRSPSASCRSACRPEAEIEGLDVPEFGVLATPTSCCTTRRPATSGPPSTYRRRRRTAPDPEDVMKLVTAHRQAAQARRREGGAAGHRAAGHHHHRGRRASAASAGTPRCTAAPSTRSTSCRRCKHRGARRRRRRADGVADAIVKRRRAPARSATARSGSSPVEHLARIRTGELGSGGDLDIRRPPRIRHLVGTSGRPRGLSTRAGPLQ